MSLRRLAPILVVALLASGVAAGEEDPIIQQYRAENIDALLNPALQKALALAAEGRVRESNQAVLDAVPEAKRRPVHDFALGNVLYSPVKNALVGSERVGLGGLTRKAKELVISTKMSRQWSKDQVLES